MMTPMIYQFITMLTWSDLLDPIKRLFVGGNGIEGIFGNETIAAIFLFIFLMALTFILGLGMIVGSVVIIPSLFLVFQYIPTIRIIVAMILGLILGFGLHKMIKR